MLAGDIDGRVCSPDLSVRRCDVDDAPLTLRNHDPDLVLHRKQNAEHVRVERAAVARCILLDDRARLSFRGGVVDRHIQSTEAGDGLVDEISNFLLDAYVSAEVLSFRPQSAKLANELVPVRLAASRNDDARLVARVGDGGSAANSGKRAGDENDGLSHATSPRNVWTILDSAAPRHRSQE